MIDQDLILILREENEQLKVQVISLKSKVQLLLSELSKKKEVKDSSNSHNPPSQDKFKSRVNKSLRTKSDRKSGGQQGHKGHHLELVSEPTFNVDLKSNSCQQCGQNLEGQQVKLVSKRQVVDIPAVAPVYTQYSQYSCACPNCNHEQKGIYPSGVNAPIQYGQSVEAYVSYLSVFQYIPYKRLKLLLKDLFNLNLSEGSIENLLKRSAKKSKGFYQQIKDEIEKANFVGSDETGAKVNGQKWWIWVWQNALNTFLKASSNRGSKTIDETFSEGLPNAIIGSDRWAAQLKTISKGKQLCLAHLFRDVVWLKESEGHFWADQFNDLLTESLQLRKTAIKKGIPFHQQDLESIKIEEKLNQLLATTLIKEKNPETYKFQKSIIKNRNYLFSFLYNLEVPPDNNGSERAIRNVKVKQKVSGQFKTGQDDFCTLRSVIDTLSKREFDIMNALSQIMNNSFQTT